MLQKKLAPDYLLYNHFLERFNQQVRDFGLARMAAAVDRLQELMALLVSRCNFVRKDFLEFREGKKPCSKKVSVRAGESFFHPSCVRQLFHSVFAGERTRE